MTESGSTFSDVLGKGPLAAMTPKNKRRLWDQLNYHRERGAGCFWLHEHYPDESWDFGLTQALDSPNVSEACQNGFVVLDNMCDGWHYLLVKRIVGTGLFGGDKYEYEAYRSLPYSDNLTFVDSSRSFGFILVRLGVAGRKR